MPMHELFLESNDKNVRVAAGENIALMFETLRTSQVPYPCTTSPFVLIVLNGQLVERRGG